MSKKEGNYIEFPEAWDRTDPYAHKQHEKCKYFYGPGEDEKFLKVFESSAFFNIFCTIVVVYTLIASALILIKSKTYKKMNWNINISLLFSLGTIINVLNFFIRRFKFYDYPCFLVPILSGFGYPLSFISGSAIIIFFLKQCYVNDSLYEKFQKIDSNNKYSGKKGYLRGLCFSFTEARIIKTIFIIITVSMFYIVIAATFDLDFTMNPISHGFCSSQYLQLPEYLIIATFIFVFSPMAIYDIRLFRNAFSFGRIFLVSLFLITVCSALYVIFSYSSKYGCSTISRFLPTDFYIVLLFFIFNLSFITAPLIESVIINKDIDRLDLTKKGMLKIFSNDVLYKEFFEYAVMKRSVEYVLFHVEYMEFKSIFLANRSILDEFRSSGLTSPGPKPSNPKDKKAVQIFEQIYDKAGDIYNKFFNDSSELQLNLPAKIAKEVNTNLFNFNIYYGRNYINAEEGKPVDLDQLICESMFDKVHSEAIESLFLNVYSSFAKEKKLNTNSRSNNREDSLRV